MDEGAEGPKHNISRGFRVNESLCAATSHLSVLLKYSTLLYVHSGRISLLSKQQKLDYQRDINSPFILSEYDWFNKLNNSSAIFETSPRNS
ncbi:1-Cys peroxiredoxin [Dirofilaria immitis]